MKLSGFPFSPLNACTFSSTNVLIVALAAVEFPHSTVNQFYLVRALLRVIARRKRLQHVEDTQHFDKVGIIFGKFSFQTGQVFKKIGIRFDSQRESQIIVRNLKSIRTVCERDLSILETLSIEPAKKWREKSLVGAGRRMPPIHVEEIEILRVVTIHQDIHQDSIFRIHRHMIRDNVLNPSHVVLSAAPRRALRGRRVLPTQDSTDWGQPHRSR